MTFLSFGLTSFHHIGALDGFDSRNWPLPKRLNPSPPSFRHARPTRLTPPVASDNKAMHQAPAGKSRSSNSKDGPDFGSQVNGPADAKPWMLIMLFLHRDIRTEPLLCRQSTFVRNVDNCIADDATEDREDFSGAFRILRWHNSDGTLPRLARQKSMHGCPIVEVGKPAAVVLCVC